MPKITERKTSAYIADFLQRESLHVQRGIARFGVVGTLDTGRPGKTLLLRADMDALPIQEETGLGLLPNISLRGVDTHRSQKITVMEDGILTQAEANAKAYLLLLLHSLGFTEVEFQPKIVPQPLVTATPG